MFKIKYVENESINPTAAMQIISEFPQYYWRTEEKTRKAICSSLCNVAAYDCENGKLVGFVLAGSPDNAYFIYIHSLMVAPAYQNMHIGETLIKKILMYCKKLDYMDIVCFAAPGARDFLEKLGFEKDLGNIQGMILNKEKVR